MECKCGSCVFTAGCTPEVHQPLIDSSGVPDNVDELEHTQMAYSCELEKDNLGREGSVDDHVTFTDLLLTYPPLSADPLFSPPNSTVGLTEIEDLLVPVLHPRPPLEEGNPNGEGSGNDHVTLTDLMSKYPDIFVHLLHAHQPDPTDENSNEQERQKKKYETWLSIALFVGSVPGSLSNSSFHPAGSRSRTENILFYCFIVSNLLSVLLFFSSTLLYLFIPTATTGESRRWLSWASHMTFASLSFMFVAFVLSVVTLDDATQSTFMGAVSGAFLIFASRIFSLIKCSSLLSG